jgi:hypothetical protein
MHAKLALGVGTKLWSAFRAYRDRLHRTAVKHRALEFLLKGRLKGIGSRGEGQLLRGR